ncbi:MAG: C40 family peptidase [Candidatus Krumholzibacteriia bacterium]
MPAMPVMPAMPAMPVMLVVLALLAGPALLLQGCAPKRVFGPYPAEIGSAPSVGAPRPVGLGPATGAMAARGEAVAREALALVGAAYRPGGDTPAGGFDCSGFVRHVCLGQGVPLPRQTRDQAAAGQSVAPDGLSPGDLVFFDMHGRGVSHVGIWIGSGCFVHAPKAGRSVRVERLDDPYWKARFTGGRRP